MSTELKVIVISTLICHRNMDYGKMSGVNKLEAFWNVHRYGIDY